MTRVVSSKQLLLVKENIAVFYHCGALYVADGVGKKENRLCSIPGNVLTWICLRIPWIARALRLQPRCAVWVNEDVFLFAMKGHIYRVSLQNKSILIEHDFQDGMTAPLYFCSVTGLRGFNNAIMYGTYVTNNDRVSIWSRNNEGKWHIAYTFPTQKVLHIHNIIADVKNNRLLILTGDSNKESGIWSAKNEFASVEMLFGGSQKCRSCVAFALEKRILYATDTPLEDNFLFSYNEECDEIFTMNQLPGPVIYGTKVGKYFVFSTTVEPDSRLKGMRYLLTNRLGSGVSDEYSHVFIGNEEEKFKEVARFRKDILPMGLFQFGNVCFPVGSLERVYICPQNVKKFSGKTLEVLH